MGLDEPNLLAHCPVKVAPALNCLGAANSLAEHSTPRPQAALIVSRLIRFDLKWGFRGIDGTPLRLKQR